jgi:DNA (cytosine-5)-methyltransferase 1
MICRIRPDFFVIENVAGLYRFRKHRSFLNRQIAYLRRAGNYAVDLKLLNSLELGAPQDRERLFVVGFRKSLANRSLGRLVKPKETGWFAWPRVDKYANAKRLPWPQSCRFKYTPARPDGIPLELTVYSALVGNGDPEKAGNGREHFNSYSPKFRAVREGDVSRKSFKRLHRYRFSPTAWYGNQEVHLHPWKPRRLSVREALRIQTVPDEYVLPTNASLSAKFKMICNGVPCLMASRLAEAVKEFIHNGLK